MLRILCNIIHNYLHQLHEILGPFLRDRNSRDKISKHPYTKLKLLSVLFQDAVSSYDYIALLT